MQMECEMLTVTKFRNAATMTEGGAPSAATYILIIWKLLVLFLVTVGILLSGGVACPLAGLIRPV